MHISNLLLVSLIFLSACTKNSDSPSQPQFPDGPTVRLKVEQKGEKIPDATVKFVYQEDGQSRSASAQTDAEGRISMDLPYNKEMLLTITSKCGILLYERKVGPFTETKRMDTTLKMQAYSAVCETAAPDQYITYNIQGVIYRHATPQEFSFNITDQSRMTYWGRKAQNEGIAIEFYHTSFGTQFITINTSENSYTTSFTSSTFTEKGDFGEYMAGTFSMNMEYLFGGGPELAPDYKINGTFRLKRRHYKEAPDWEFWFPE